MQETTTDRTDDVPQVSTWKPPRWANRMMIWLLRTPGIERLIGRSIALITFKGRKSGDLYTTPVTYLRKDGEVMILSKRFRIWWRNLLDNPQVVLRLAGSNLRGLAEVMPTGDESLETLLDFLEQQRQDVRAYGLNFDEDGRIDPDRARAVLPQIAVIRVSVVDSASEPNPSAS